MPLKSTPPPVLSAPALCLRLRLVRDAVTILGPGKVELLQGIADTGSLAEAARRMGMSYNRAWLHVKTCNAAFCEPLVVTLRGGKAGGGAELSATGKKVVALYSKMVRSAEKAAEKSGAALQALLGL